MEWVMNKALLPFKSEMLPLMKHVTSVGHANENAMIGHLVNVQGVERATAIWLVRTMIEDGALSPR